MAVAADDMSTGRVLDGEEVATGRAGVGGESVGHRVHLGAGVGEGDLIAGGDPVQRVVGVGGLAVVVDQATEGVEDVGRLLPRRRGRGQGAGAIQGVVGPAS